MDGFMGSRIVAMIIVGTSLTSGCGERINREQFSTISKSAEATRQATHGATSLREFETALLGFARAVSSFSEQYPHLEDRPITDPNRRLIVLYGAAFGAYKDSATIWAQTRNTDDWPPTDEIGQATAKYLLPNTAQVGRYDPDLGRFETGSLIESLRVVWGVANRRVLSANAALAGKKSIDAAADDVFEDYPDMRPDLDLSNPEMVKRDGERLKLWAQRLQQQRALDRSKEEREP